MISYRGVLCILTTIIIVFFALPLLSFAIGAAPGPGSNPTQVTTPPPNLAATANTKDCDQDERVYNLKCDVPEKMLSRSGVYTPTGRKGGLFCPCSWQQAEWKVTGYCSARYICHATKVENTDKSLVQKIGDTGSSATPPETKTPASAGGSGAAAGPGAGGAPPDSAAAGKLPGSDPIGQAFTSKPQVPAPQPAPASNPAISGINNLAGGTYNPSTVSGPSVVPPSTAGLNWSYLGQYAQTLGGQAPQIIPQQPNVIYYYPGYEIASRQNTSGFVSPTITQSGQSFYGPIKDYSSFIEIMSRAGGSVVSAIENMYDSFAGITKPDISPIPEFNDRSPITILDSQANLAENPGTTTGEQPTNPSFDRPAASQEVLFAVQQVQDSLRALNSTLAMRRKPIEEASSTPQTTEKSGNEPVPNNSTRPTTTPEISSHDVGADELANKAETALKAAQERVAKLQDEIESGQMQLQKSSAKVKELMAELNEMNRRIQEVNQALADPNVSDSDHENLVNALLTNIQLTLNDAEKKLEQAVAEEKPRTVGEVVVAFFNSNLSGFVQWTVHINQAISAFIQSFWHTLFSAS